MEELPGMMKRTRILLPHPENCLLQGSVLYPLPGPILLRLDLALIIRQHSK